MSRLSIGRLTFFWWGSFLRGWLQWGRAGRTCADKDYSKHTLWSYLIGPVQVEWWNDPNWRAYCFTREEAAAEDAWITAGTSTRDCASTSDHQNDGADSEGST